MVAKNQKYFRKILNLKIHLDSKIKCHKVLKIKCYFKTKTIFKKVKIPLNTES